MPRSRYYKNSVFLHLSMLFSTFAPIGNATTNYNDYFFPNGSFYTTKGVYVKPVDRSHLGYTVSFDVYCSYFQLFPSGRIAGDEKPTDERRITPEQAREAIERSFTRCP